MAGSEKKVRGREPPIFSGAEDYEDWELTVLSYLAMENARYIYLLDNYPKRRANATAPLAEDVLKGHYDGGQATADVVMTLNQRLYFILLNNTSGSARQIVRAVTDFHGLEAICQLGMRYGRTRAHETLTSMHKVMHRKVTEDDYEGHLLNWERDIAHFELSSGQSMADQTKVVILIANLHGKTKDHVHLSYREKHELC